jgi:hypothetical protein
MMLPALKPCPRPFCDGSASLLQDEGFHWIECGACHYRMSVRRDPSREDLAGLVAAWNAEPLPPAEALPTYLRQRAATLCAPERFQLLDAAELIERQAAALVQQAARA